MTTLFDAPPAADTLGPGIHTIPAEDYHRDPCPEPSLSASIAALMCNRSPRHAWTQHPRLNPEYAPKAKPAFDVGTVAHELLLRGQDICEVIDAPDRRKKETQAACMAARESGRVPLLAHEYDAVCALVERAREQFAQRNDDPPMLTDGTPEATIVWDEHGVTCRARLDWLRDDSAAIDDIKTTAGSAAPDDWARRRLFDIGADVQVAFYERGIERLTGRRPEFRFAVVETTPPHALSVVSLAPSALELARDKVQVAIETWRACLASGDWPGYPDGIAYAEAPAWHLEQWLTARQLAEVGS